MNLTEAQALAIQLMTEHGLISSGWRFRFDNAKRRFGVCKHYRKIIGLSAPLVELNGIEKVTDTILHEIAHALVGGGHGHDHVWRAKALSIGSKAKRCYGHEVRTPPAKYIAICIKCNHEHKKHIKPREGKQQSCGVCSRRFNPETILVWNLVESQISLTFATDEAQSDNNR